MTTKPIIKDDIPEIKEIELEAIEVQSNAIIVKVDGWRIRVYFKNESSVDEAHVGKKVKVSYTGDIDDVHSLKFEKI